MIAAPNPKMNKNIPIIFCLLCLHGITVAASENIPPKIKLSPYNKVFDCDESIYRSRGIEHKFIFCVLGYSGEPRGRVVAAYESKNNSRYVRVFMDRDRGLNPWKVVMCELDGDAEPELALGVYKSTRFYPAPDNRLFIYDWNGKFIFPKWLGSRIALPMIDFTFIRSSDETDRLIALEHVRAEIYFIRLYTWNGFGFMGEEETINPATRDQGTAIIKAVETGETPEIAARRIIQ